MRLQAWALVLVGCTSLIQTVSLPAYADSVRDSEWYLATLQIPESHKISQGEGIIVAVIDTGVNARQPELSGNVLVGADESRGFIGNGWQDSSGHGTAMASLIAAHGKNERDGALGIAPKAHILPVRAAASGNVLPEDVRKSIAWALQHHPKVICIASGGPQSDLWKPALDAALASDVVLVGAVGNRNEGAKSVVWPAAYPGVIAAAGIDRAGQHADFSVTGPEVVLSAPAVDIVTPGRNGQYITGSGTSAATAIIAGAAALVRAKFPNLPAAEVVHRLEATATDAGPPGRDDQYGYGILNIVRALTADVPPLATSAQPSPTTPNPGAAPRRNTSNLPLTGILLALFLAAGGAVALITMRRHRH
ncbi:MAG TPA: S8 family serine peptidase [Rugosimonospora sp.]|nr:S8 family serine peptidase [Rugosimonospora sp.]